VGLKHHVKEFAHASEILDQSGKLKSAWMLRGKVSTSDPLGTRQIVQRVEFIPTVFHLTRTEVSCR
jgi:predicted transcriptional regulator